MRSWSAALRTAIVWLATGTLSAGTAVATNFTLENPIEISVGPPFEGRATILPDDTTSGDLVCLDPSSACLDVEVLAFRVSVEPGVDFQTVGVSAPDSSISGAGYFVTGGVAPPNGVRIAFDGSNAIFNYPSAGGQTTFLEPGETSETLVVAFGAGSLIASQTVVFSPNFSGWLPLDVPGTIIPVPEPSAALSNVAALAALAALAGRRRLEGSKYRRPAVGRRFPYLGRRLLRGPKPPSDAHSQICEIT
jgi:hypothetical protein